MASFVKFYDFAEQLGKGVHHLHSGGDTLKAYLTAATPSASTHTIKADIAEITGEHGYSTGGEDIQNDYSETGGTGTLTSVDIVWTATGGSFGPFRYVVIYNDTATSPNDALVGYADYGTSITVLEGETFTVNFGASLLTIS